MIRLTFLIYNGFLKYEYKYDYPNLKDTSDIRDGRYDKNLISQYKSSHIPITIYITIQYIFCKFNQLIGYIY